MPPPSIAPTAGAIESPAPAAAAQPAAANEHRVAIIMFGITVAVCAGFIAMIVAEVL